MSVVSATQMPTASSLHMFQLAFPEPTQKKAYQVSFNKLTSLYTRAFILLLNETRVLINFILLERNMTNDSMWAFFICIQLKKTLLYFMRRPENSRDCLMFEGCDIDLKKNVL